MDSSHPRATGEAGNYRRLLNDEVTTLGDRTVSERREAEVFAKSPATTSWTISSSKETRTVCGFRPRDQCSDAEFIRLRVPRHLRDSAEAGRSGARSSPTRPEEAREAHRQTAGPPRVRRLLVAQVVGPLLVSSRKLPQPAMWAFYRKLRQSVADNQPWDQFARDILLPRAAVSLSNGGGNYFVLHKRRERAGGGDAGHVPRHVDRLREVPQPSAGSGPRTNTGRSRTCSPAVGLKNGDRTGEVLVQSSRGRRASPAQRRARAAQRHSTGKAMPRRLARRPPRASSPTGSPRANNPYFAKAAVNRIWRNLHGPRAGRGRRRPARNEPGEQS